MDIVSLDEKLPRTPGEKVRVEVEVYYIVQNNVIIAGHHRKGHSWA